MKTNSKAVYTGKKTHEGAVAYRTNFEQELRRTIMSSLLWESNYYEDGISIAKRVEDLVSKVSPVKVAQMAVEARENMKLRHMPLWIVRQMVKHDSHKVFVASTLERIIQRADEISEFLSLYWMDGKTPIANSVKNGLASAFKKFDEYQFAKYNRDSQIKLRDVLFMVHPKPDTQEQQDLWNKIVNNDLDIPDTWEVALSSGANKKETWERLIQENKLGALAFLRNLRNMIQSNVSEKIVFEGLKKMRTERVLPFRFISAAKYAPQWESELEEVMFKCLDGKEKLQGKTVLLVDVSGSMGATISEKSDLTRWEVAAGLSMLAREICEHVSIYTFSTNCKQLPNRRGFALKDLIRQMVGGGTNTGDAVKMINQNEKYDRLIIFTDEQSHQSIPNPTGKGYVVNVASNQNGIGYGTWIHIDGWSEAILDYILESEK